MMGNKRVLEVFDELKELHAKKSADYGQESGLGNLEFVQSQFGIKPSLGVFIRMSDKWSRLCTFVRRGELQNESVADTLRDLAVYAVLALVLLEEGK